MQQRRESLIAQITTYTPGDFILLPRCLQDLRIHLEDPRRKREIKRTASAKSSTSTECDLKPLIQRDVWDTHLHRSEASHIDSSLPLTIFHRPQSEMAFLDLCTLSHAKCGFKALFYYWVYVVLNGLNGPHGRGYPADE